MTSGTFKCSRCKGVFDKEWSDEEAAEELAENFPGYGQDECDIVCDDCYAWLLRQSMRPRR